MTNRITTWARAGKSRVYVSTEGRRLGYFDPDGTPDARLVPDPDSPNPEKDQRDIAKIIADRMGVSTSRVAIVAHPWTDLAVNQPAASIVHMYGRDGYAAGIQGEQRTAGVLTPLLNSGWRLINSIPLGPNKDIDHMLIGPVGILAINSKSSSYPVQVTSEGNVVVDGYSKSWIDSSSRDAEVAQRVLSAACREHVYVNPLVVVWTPSQVSGADHRVVSGHNLLKSLVTLPQVLDRSWVEQIFSVARRSDTWAEMDRM